MTILQKIFHNDFFTSVPLQQDKHKQIESIQDPIIAKTEYNKLTQSIYISISLILSQMKSHSPGHPLIQLRRKTQKFVSRKPAWDFSNKENNNGEHNNEDVSKSKNSSKKNSIEKNQLRPSFKKDANYSQNTLKCQLKNAAKNSDTSKERKDSSLKKKKIGKNNENRVSELNINNMKIFAEVMDNLLEHAKNEEPIDNLALKYAKQLMKFSSSSESERIIFSTLSEHLIFWIEKCQLLQKQQEGSVGETECLISRPKQNSDTELSEQPSMCSYIVDPKQQIRMKPLREDLKQQLQLNFTKVDYFRKKQIQR